MIIRQRSNGIPHINSRKRRLLHQKEAAVVTTITEGPIAKPPAVISVLLLLLFVIRVFKNAILHGSLTKNEM